jgi:ATP-dependent helicase/nuclease subunit B
MTRASERLWISYPRTDGEGKHVNPSPYLQDLLNALPGLTVERVGDRSVERSTDDITSVSDLAARLATEFRYRVIRVEDTDPGLRAEWNALYEASQSREEWHGTLARGLSGLAYRNEARLERSVVERAIATPLAASVSRLEKFAACPFAHFANYLLALEPRVEADLQLVDLGTLCHAILEKFIAELTRNEERLADLADDEIATRIDAMAKEIEPSISDEMLLDHARNAYLFDRSRGHMERVTRWQRDAARVGRFRPAAVEWPFGFSGSKAAPLTLTTPKGRTIHLRGYIDRVDVAELGDALVGAVIDYKRTTQRRLNLAQVYHGLSLQLIGYLLALRQSGESLTGRPILPVAAFYLPLLEPFVSVSHPDENKRTTYQCRGIADLAALPVLDNTVGPGGKSAFFSASLTKAGEPYVQSDLAPSEQLAALMRHVGQHMGELADEIIDGNIAVAPYRLNRQTPCSFCEFRAVCRYEIETQPPRALESLDKTEVFKRLEEGSGEG